MRRDIRLYLSDLVEACESIRSYTTGLDLQGFLADRRTVDAVLRNLQILGEAAKKLPPEVLASAPQIPWREVAGLRDILVHAYFKVDLQVIWDTVQNDLPALEAAARRLADDRSTP